MAKCVECVPGFSRRSFLRFSLGAGAMGAVPHSLLAQQTQAKQASGRTAKAVIMLWMGGGPTQIDTWDPKPGSRNAGEFVKRWFAEIGSAGGHRAMAKAVVPMDRFLAKHGDLDPAAFTARLADMAEQFLHEPATEKKLVTSR